MQVKIGLQMRPKDELYIFVYDKDQIYIPSVSRVYGSDFRKISDVSNSERNVFICVALNTNLSLDKNGGGQI